VLRGGPLQSWRDRVDGAEESAELLAELARLKEEHRDLDRAIEALETSPVHDRLQLQRLKKRKLTLRDRIHRIEDQILPDIIA
jgi:hypothetical protein